MKRILFSFVLTVAAALAAGCSKGSFEKDTFQKPTYSYELSVEGGINTLLSLQYIRLTKPSMSNDSLPTPVSHASVIVNDSKQDIIFTETNQPGVYMAVNHNDPNYNKGYTLTIRSNGKTYTAVDTLRQVVNIVDDFLPLSTKTLPDQRIQGTIPKHTFGYLNPSKWLMSYRDIPFWQPSRFDQDQYFSFTHFLGSPNSLYPLNNLKREFILDPEEEITIFKISLSEQYARYLYSVFMETDWSGLFSAVPVNVKGNISGNAQGYFSVADIDVRRYRAKEL